MWKIPARRILILPVAGGLLAALLSAVTSSPAGAALASVPHYSLPVGLQESLYFYDALSPARPALPVTSR